MTNGEPGQPGEPGKAGAPPGGRGGKGGKGGVGGQGRRGPRGRSTYNGPLDFVFRNALPIVAIIAVVAHILLGPH